MAAGAPSTASDRSPQKETSHGAMGIHTRTDRASSRIGGEGREPEAIREMNRLGLDGWEVCSVLADQQAWIVLLKREIPVMGIGGSGGSGGSA
jgi:hypothetical protein